MIWDWVLRAALGETLGVRYRLPNTSTQALQTLMLAFVATILFTEPTEKSRVGGVCAVRSMMTIRSCQSWSDMRGGNQVQVYIFRCDTLHAHIQGVDGEALGQHLLHLGGGERGPFEEKAEALQELR